MTFRTEEWLLYNLSVELLTELINIIYKPFLFVQFLEIHTQGRIFIIDEDQFTVTCILKFFACKE